MTRADRNTQTCDVILEQITRDDNKFMVVNWGLYLRTITHPERDKLESAMTMLAMKVDFDRREIFIENGYGYEIVLLRSIIDFD